MGPHSTSTLNSPPHEQPPHHLPQSQSRVMYIESLTMQQQPNKIDIYI